MKQTRCDDDSNFILIEFRPFQFCLVFFWRPRLFGWKKKQSGVIGLFCPAERRKKERRFYFFGRLPINRFVAAAAAAEVHQVD